MKTKKIQGKHAYYLIIIVISVVLDRLVKIAVEQNLSSGAQIEIIGDTFKLAYTLNSGAAFSMFADHTWMLTLVSLALIIACLVFLIKYRNMGLRPATVGLSLLIGGGIGNLIDRLAYSYVIDMFALKHFAVFNVADICVCVGAGLVLIHILFCSGKRDVRK